MSKSIEDTFAAHVKDHGVDNHIDTRSICHTIARRLATKFPDWAHFPECHFRDDPRAKRWNPFKRVIVIWAVEHNDAIKDREEEELAAQFAQVGIEEGEEEVEEDDLASKDTLDFSHLKDDQANLENGPVDPKITLANLEPAHSYGTRANMLLAAHCQ